MKYLKLLVVLSILQAMACSKVTKVPEIKSMEGIWVLQELLIDSEIVTATPPLNEFSYETIEITFPDSLSGGAWGHTYKNEVAVRYLINIDEIEFTDYFSTREAEDSIGIRLEILLLDTKRYLIDDQIMDFYNETDELLLKFKKNK